jgi:hypothetical protein
MRQETGPLPLIYRAMYLLNGLSRRRISSKTKALQRIIRSISADAARRNHLNAVISATIMRDDRCESADDLSQYCTYRDRSACGGTITLSDALERAQRKSFPLFFFFYACYIKPAI